MPPFFDANPGAERDRVERKLCQLAREPFLPLILSLSKDERFLSAWHVGRHLGAWQPGRPIESALPA